MHLLVAFLILPLSPPPALQEGPPEVTPAYAQDLEVPDEPLDETSGETPGKPGGEAADATSAPPLIVRAERLYVRPGEVLEDAAVLIEDGVIVAVGKDLELPEGAREIAGAVVCAGFLDPWSTLGVNVNDVREQKTSAATLTVDALDLVEQDHARREALAAGVVAVRAQAGENSSVGGVGGVIRTAPGLPGEKRVLLGDSVVAASIGVGAGSSNRDVFARISELDKLVDSIESGRKYLEDKIEYRYDLEKWEKEIAEKEAELEKGFKKAQKDREKDIEKAKEKDKEHKDKTYKEAKKPREPRYDEDKEVFARVANGELPLIVQANRAAELRGLLERTESFDRLRLVISGGTEATAVAKQLAERRIPVIVFPAPLGTSVPDELRGHDLSLASQLADAGVKVLIGSGGSGAATRELPLFAALAVGHGLDREDAFKALTWDAARTLDLGDRLGSLERGKEAELLVLDGEPLMTTTRVRFVVSAGRVVHTSAN